MFKIDVSVPQHEQIVGVRTTENRGFTPDELAEQCVEKIVSVSVVLTPTSCSCCGTLTSTLNIIVLP